MDELNDGSHLVMPYALIAKRPGSQQHECRTHAFAATIDDVLGNLPDQHHVGVKSIANDRIDGLHIRPDQGVELFQSHVR